MMRLFPFAANAPVNFKKDLTANASNNKKYALAAKITPWTSITLSTILAAIQVSLDNTNAGDKTTIDNSFTPIIAATSAISILLTSIFSYLQTTTESKITALTIDGVKRNYFDIESTGSTISNLEPIPAQHNPISISLPEPASEAQTNSNELNVAQQITADALIRRFTR